jgi:large subunit ribosomal protein L6
MGSKTERSVEIPEGVQATLEDNILTVKGEKGELKRDFRYPKMHLEQDGNKITIRTELDSKQDRAIVGAYEAHINNMFKGVMEGFTYKLKVVYSHFPMTIKQKEDIIEISNFFGEKAPRTSKVFGDAKVDIQKDEIIVESINKEDAGQTAGNLELATRVKRKDTRVFQDGIYIVEKP